MTLMYRKDVLFTGVAKVVLGVGSLVLLYVISTYNYSLFHSLVDGVSIIIAACTFAVIWNSRRYVDNNYFLFTGIAFLFFAFFDSLHLLGNKDMGIFPGYGNLGPTFYIASRYILSISLVIAPWFINRTVKISVVFSIYTLITAIVLATVLYWKIFPACIIEGKGLTLFKVISDYVVCLILGGALWLLVVNRRFFSPRVLRMIVYSIALSIATGLTFSLYIDPFGITNMIGHLFQIVSFYLVYRAFIETSLTEPQEILFRKLNRAQETLLKTNDELEKRVEGRTFELKAAYEELKREIQERQRAEDHLRQAQKIEALGTLTGGIAHDFNNLLSAIIGFAEILEEDLPAGSLSREHATHIMGAGMRGRDLVKQLLTFSRKTEHEKKPLKLSSIIKESVKMLRASMPSTIAIDVNVENGSGYVLADPVQVQQVILNLCTNAYHAMREKGGSLSIELADITVEPGNDTMPPVDPGPYARVMVRDTGTGIPADIRDRIFDPFFTTKPAGEGTGLGLSVVMGIVKESHGHITVDSQPGKGTLFSVFFPLAIPGSIDSTAKEEPAPSGKEHILLVDDDPILLEMEKQLLRRLGYEVTCQQHSGEALGLVRENPNLFDLVITDQTMPDLTGIQLAKKILEINRALPIILCTGFSDTVDFESTKNAGIRKFIMKPVTKNEMAKTIRDVFHAKDP
ncbi:MAG: MASE3 domain-containing protein [Syntrophorhabdus sp.]